MWSVKVEHLRLCKKAHNSVVSPQLAKLIYNSSFMGKAVVLDLKSLFLCLFFICRLETIARANPTTVNF